MARRKCVCQSSGWILYHQSWSSWVGRAIRASRCPLHSQQPEGNGTRDYHAGPVVAGAVEKVIERLKSNKVENNGRGSGVMNQRKWDFLIKWTVLLE